MQEFWINNQDDWQDFLSFIQDEKLTMKYEGNDTEGFHLLKAGDVIVHAPQTYYDPKPVKNKYDPLIFGKDQTENIVNISMKDGMVHIYQRAKDKVNVTSKPYKLWYLSSENGKRLKGYQYYKYINECDETTYDELKEDWNPRLWLPRSKEEGYMLDVGATYFKGMRVEDVSILSTDIETTTMKPHHDGAKVVLISNTFRVSGKYTRRLFDVNDYSGDDVAMIKDWCSWVRSIDPDIIIGHNVFGFDFEYLAGRCPLTIGRDGSEMIFDTKPSKMRKDGSQEYEYFNARVFGRDIVDSMFLSLKYDISRNFPSYGLKVIEKHLKLVDSSRVEWNFEKHPVSETYKQGGDLWKQFCTYCSQDGDSPIKMFDIMIPAFFYMTQSVPKTLQQVINEASGSQLDSLMVRAYLQNGYSQPRTSKSENFEGAISMGIPGIYTNVRKVDVASLYPSIMLNYNIYDKRKDPDRRMLGMLEYFRNERLNNKRLAKETGDKYYDDLQNSQKIMINSLYGFMGANFLLYNYPEGAAEVTKHGREILLKAVEWATGHTLSKVIKKIRNEGKHNEKAQYEWILGEKLSEGKGYTLVNTDTDSFSYTNGKVPTTEEFDAEIENLNSIYPKLISWEKDGKDGLFDKIVVVAAKNYVLVRDGKVKIKGSSILDQKKEPALKEFLEKCINLFLEEKEITEFVSLYDSYCKEASNIQDIYRWVVKKTITSPVLNPERLNEQKVYDAIQEALAHKVIAAAQEGDKIYLYQAIDGLKPKMAKGKPEIMKKTGLPKMVDNTVLRVPQLYQPGKADKWHYVERVYDTLSILENLLDLKQFTKYGLKNNRKLLTNE